MKDFQNQKITWGKQHCVISLQIFLTSGLIEDNLILVQFNCIKSTFNCNVAMCASLKDINKGWPRSGAQMENGGIFNGLSDNCGYSLLLY